MLCLEMSAQPNTSVQLGRGILPTQKAGVRGMARDWLVLKDPYLQDIPNPQQVTCAPLQGINIARSVTYNTYLEKWVAVGDDVRTIGRRRIPGFYFSISDDLVHWSEPKLILKLHFLEVR